MDVCWRVMYSGITIGSYIYGNVCYANHLRMQIMETPIWVIGSTSKGRGAGGGRGDLQKCDYPIQGRMVNCKITPFSCPLDLDPVV